jgi:hypothetical protein
MLIDGLDVVFDIDAGWQVRPAGGGHPLSTHPTQPAAEAAAVRHALERDQAAIAVHGESGTLRYVRRVR